MRHSNSFLKYDVVTLFYNLLSRVVRALNSHTTSFLIDYHTFEVDYLDYTVE